MILLLSLCFDAFKDIAQPRRNVTSVKTMSRTKSGLSENDSVSLKNMRLRKSRYVEKSTAVPLAFSEP